MAGADDVSELLEAKAAKLSKRFKRTRRELKTLHATAAEALKAAQALQAALRSIKPAPKADAKVKEAAEKAGRTQELTRYQQVASRYEELRDDTMDELSPRGQRKWMLNQLVRMADASLDQHTGGKAGEGTNRRSSRDVTQALKSLRAGQKRLQRAGTNLVPRKTVPLEVGPDTPVNSLDQMVASLKAEGKQLGVAQLTFKKTFGLVEAQLDELAEGLSGEPA